MEYNIMPDMDSEGLSLVLLALSAWLVLMVGSIIVACFYAGRKLYRTPPIKFHISDFDPPAVKAIQKIKLTRLIR